MSSTEKTNSEATTPQAERHICKPSCHNPCMILEDEADKKKARAVAPVETRLTELPYSPDDLQLEKAVGTIGIIALAGLPENSGFFFDAPKVRAVISEYAAQSKAPVETPGVQVIAFGTFNSGFLQHVSTTRLDAEAWARHHLADSPEVEIKRMTFYRAPEPPEQKVETRLTAEQFYDNWMPKQRWDDGFPPVHEIAISFAEAFRDKSESKLRQEITRLKLQYTVAHCWWDDDTRRESPEEHADELGMKVGAEFTLQASTYWDETFRVTKVPDDASDDYECEQISQQPEEFETYHAMENQVAGLREEIERLKLVLGNSDKTVNAGREMEREQIASWREAAGCPEEYSFTRHLTELRAKLAGRESPDHELCDNQNNHPQSCHCTDPLFWKRRADAAEAEVAALRERERLREGN